MKVVGGEVQGGEDADSECDGVVARGDLGEEE